MDYFHKNWNNLENTLLVATCVVTDRAKNKWVREVKQALEQWLNVAITGCWGFTRWSLISEYEFYLTYPELKKYMGRIVLLPESPLKDGFGYKIWWKSSVYTKHFSRTST